MYSRGSGPPLPTSTHISPLQPACWSLFSHVASSGKIVPVIDVEGARWSRLWKVSRTDKDEWRSEEKIITEISQHLVDRQTKPSSSIQQLYHRPVLLRICPHVNALFMQAGGRPVQRMTWRRYLLSKVLGENKGQRSFKHDDFCTERVSQRETKWKELARLISSQSGPV